MTIDPNILILPWLNPVHVAEEAATLDVLTGGNYILGVGWATASRNSTRSAFRYPSARRGSTKRSG